MWRLDAVGCAAAGLVYGGVLAIRILLSPAPSSPPRMKQSRLQAFLASTAATTQA